MFRIYSAYNIGVMGVHKSWTLKDPKPQFHPIVTLMASDEELAHIYNYFRGIPSRMCKDEVIWNGVYAQFIYDNL